MFPAIDPSIVSLLALSLEKCINTALKCDPSSQAKLSELSGKAVLVRAKDLDINLHLVVFEETLQIQLPQSDQLVDLPHDVDIYGDASALINIFFEKNQTLAGSGVEAHGELNVLRTLNVLIANLDIDLEDAASDVLGPLGASMLGKTVSQLNAHVNQISQSQYHQLRNFIIEELRLLPTENEFAARTAAITDLRMAADRVEAKLSTLKNSILDTEKTQGSQ